MSASAGLNVAHPASGPIHGGKPLASLSWFHAFTLFFSCLVALLLSPSRPSSISIAVPGRPATTGGAITSWCIFPLYAGSRSGTVQCTGCADTKAEISIWKSKSTTVELSVSVCQVARPLQSVRCTCRVRVSTWSPWRYSRNCGGVCACARRNRYSASPAQLCAVRQCERSSVGCAQV